MEGWGWATTAAGALSVVLEVSVVVEVLAVLGAGRPYLRFTVFIIS